MDSSIAETADTSTRFNMSMQCRMKLESDRACGKYVFKCKRCSKYGCDNKDCKNINFDSSSGLCYACGQTSARV